MQIVKLDADFYLEKIRDNEPFSFSRFGDGEVLCMFNNAMRENCDGSAFLPELKEPMKQIFRNKYPYYHCLLNCSFDINGSKFRVFLNETCPEMPFYDGEVWQELSFNDRITELVETISMIEPVFVGGSHMSNIIHMKGLKNIPTHIQVPDRDSFLEVNRIIMDISTEIGKGKRMFLFSAGYTTKIIIDTLFPYVGEEIFLIDMGSVFDPYCGRLSRSGMVANGFQKFQPYTNLQLQ